MHVQSEWHLLAARIIAGGSRSLSEQTGVVMDRYLRACMQLTKAIIFEKISQNTAFHH